MLSRDTKVSARTREDCLFSVQKNGFERWNETIPFSLSLPDNGNMSRKTNALLALIFDILTFGVVLFSILWLYFGPGGVLAIGGVHAFKYFTVQSNALLGVVALGLVPLDILLYQGKKDLLPKWAFSILHLSVMATNVTMLTVIFFLGPTMGYGFLYQRANFFLHLVNPLLGLIRYLFFSLNSEEVNWKASFLGILPVVLYGTFYIANVVSHNGYGNVDYDWYGFASSGVFGAFLSIFVMLVATALGSVGQYFLWKAIKKAFSKKEEN